MSDRFTVAATSDATSLTFVLGGDIDAGAADSLDGEIRTGLFTSDVTTLILDLEHVSFMDSTGLGVVVGALRSMRERDGVLVLRKPSGTVRRLLEVTQLTGELQIED